MDRYVDRPAAGSTQLMRPSMKVRALLFAGVTLMAGFVCAQTAPAPDAAPDCSVYSLEGVRIGMTLDDVRGAQVGAELSQRGKNDRAAKTQVWRVYRKWKKDAPGVDMLVTFVGGTVVSVRNEYRRLGGILEPAYRSRSSRCNGSPPPGISE